MKWLLENAKPVLLAAWRAAVAALLAALLAGQRAVDERLDASPAVVPASSIL
jgi:hypothetical protein